MSATDAELLRSGDARAFGRVYDRHVEAVHGWFAEVTRQTRDGAQVLRIAAGRRSYVVDAKTYAPLEMRTRGTGGGTVLRFVTYETLPPDEALLSIAAQHQGAPVVRDAAAYDALLQRLFANG